MDLSAKEKLCIMFGYNNYINDKNTINKFFHFDCKFSKRKYCECKAYQPSKENISMSNLINLISSDNFKIDLINNKLKFNKKNNNNKPNYSKQHKQVINEYIDNIASRDSISLMLNQFESDFSYNNLNNLSNKNGIRNFNNLITKKDFKEIYKLILSEKKMCEYCKIELIDSNIYKGWKNYTTGENVLLCGVCSKRYLNGNLEGNSFVTVNHNTNNNNNNNVSNSLNENSNIYVGNKVNNTSNLSDNLINYNNNYINSNDKQHKYVGSSFNDLNQKRILDKNI